MYLLIAFIAIPLLEITVFIQLGGLIGLWPTLGLVLLTAVAGSALLRHQGFATLQRARGSMERGEVPVREVFDGLCLVFAGALLLTPGFVTDAMGIVLFIPAVRNALRDRMASFLKRRADMHVFVDGMPGSGPKPDARGGPSGRDPFIDAEYHEVTDERAADDEIRDDGPRDSRWGPPDSRFRP